LDYQHDAGTDWLGLPKVAMSEHTVISMPHVHYLVLGLGQTGQAVARWLHRHGVKLTLVDTRANCDVAMLREQLNDPSINWMLGSELSGQLLQNVDALVVSPGLAPNSSAIKPFIDQALANKVVVLGEIELFAQALDSLRQSHQYEPFMLGITGTNGKTTVTMMTHRMLEQAGKHSCMAGNIAPAALDALLEMLAQPKQQWPEVWVLELSSFQLHYTHSLRLSAAVVLNLTQDHLDWHGSFQSYCAAKAKIFSLAQIRIVNRDDNEVLALVESVELPDVRSFGLNEPSYLHDVGVQNSDAMKWLVCAQPDAFADPVKPSRRKKEQTTLPRGTGTIKRLMPVDALLSVGAHNTSNVLASALLAQAAGIGWAPILQAASSFTGQPHRMQFVRCVRDVDFFNDSKGTNVGATVAALRGLGRASVLIAGGQSKGQDFSALTHALKQCARAVVLIGEDAELMRRAFEVEAVEVHIQTDLTGAVAKAFELAKPGDAVLLSPACASFDMFRSYEHRGECFIDEVQELALSLGEVA
jgi:UDP-N-acetylmuramoylalanine--D-glutamate ligase